MGRSTTSRAWARWPRPGGGWRNTVTLSTELEEVVLAINVKVRSWWTHGEEELAALEALYRDAGVEGEMAFLRSWHADMLRDWPLDRLEALPAGWVHSDFHGRNMVFVDDELRGLFDFDPLHRGFWVEDIGHALFMFAREFRGSMRIRPDAARIFLDAYSATRPPPREESEAIPMMAVLAWVPSTPYQKLHHRDGEDSLAWFRHYIVLMREIEAEMSRLAPLLSC